MNIYKTSENIRKTCDSYVDPDLVAFIINDDYSMGENNIMDITDYNIYDDDSFEERLLKIHKNEHIFLAFGMMTFMPILNECDLFSDEDYHLILTEDEFKKYTEEKLFGILIKKDSDKYLIGKTDTCNCSITASFKEFEKTDLNFYKTIENIINKKIVN